MQKNRGFTLVEISIVLVIISLIVGGVLVGRDLIDNAKLRKDMGQLEKYNTAVGAFKLKYNALPGDMLNAPQYGFDSLAYGNKDGKIQGIIKGYTTVYRAVTQFGLRPEWFYVFHHLGKAGLVELSGDYVPTMGATFITGVHFPKMATNMAQSDYNNNTAPGVILAYEENNRIAGHFFRLGATPYHTTPYLLGFYGGFTPTIAKRVDNKYDDGLPVSGRIQIGPLWDFCDEDVYDTGTRPQCPQGGISTTGTWLHCALLSTGDYDQAYNVRSCGLRVRADF